MNRSATIRLGSAPGTAPSNAGAKLPGEPLSEAEANALIAAIPSRSVTGMRNRALVTILYRGGLRIAEALVLKASDIDPDRGTVRILRGKGAKARTIGLEPGAMATIQRWLDARKAAGIRGGTLFCTISGVGAGQPLSRQYVSMMLKRQAAKAGIDKRVHPHGLRHTLAAELVAEGQPITVIRDQLGHSSLAVTDRYLRNVAPGSVIAAMQKRDWAEPGVFDQAETMTP
jgi:site-specific recombinase XerD